MRQAAGRHFADVVIGVSFDSAVGQGHAAADAVERAVQAALPEADVVVHVEPLDQVDVRERAHAAALGVRSVREVHNVSVVSVGSRTELSLHLKLPGDLSLEEAHGIAEEVERAIAAAVPEVSAVQTHLEPLAEEAAGTRPRAAEVAADAETVARIVRDVTGEEPEGLRFVAHRRRPRRLPHAAARRRHPRRRARRGEPDRGADPPRAPGDHRRDRAHGAAGVILCMFTPKERELERGWPGRIDGDHVVQLAAQTLQAFFTGGGKAREHAEYPLAEVDLRAPVLRPPSVRIFDEDGDFRFANPAAIHGPEDDRPPPRGRRGDPSPCCGSPAIIGADGAIGGLHAHERLASRPALPGAKAHDFAISLGPVVITPDRVAAPASTGMRSSSRRRGTPASSRAT